MLWAVVLGTALTTFPIVLTYIGLRTRTAGATAALSGWTQSTGYLMAAIGPFGVGVLHEATDGWTVPLVVLLTLTRSAVRGRPVRRQAGPHRGPAPDPRGGRDRHRLTDAPADGSRPYRTGCG